MDFLVAESSYHGYGGAWIPAQVLRPPILLGLVGSSARNGEFWCLAWWHYGIIIGVELCNAVRTSQPGHTNARNFVAKASGRNS